MKFELEKEQKQLERKLTSLRKKDFLPAALLDIVSDTAALQLASRAAVSVQLPEHLATPDAHVQGLPLLPREQFPYDAKQTAILFGKLLALMEASGGPLAQSAVIVRKALEDGSFQLADACTAFLHDSSEFFADWAARLPDAPSLVRFLVQGSITPSLQATGLLLAELHNNDEPWAFGHCPCCGSMPIMASLHEKEGFRHLTCSFCRAEYRAKRLQCAFCGEEDHKKLEYFKAEGETGFEVHVCRTCNCYIKTTDFRELDAVSIPVLDDLESLTLDILAREQGLSRPTLSAWGF
ncbi:formate dehydrogenase accessory protein FdhE [Desulfovibrio psychrotolerans]|uniref:Formate dehydrogenase accessory protein FdhE n=1 Tax=Desulfovibrio psychrotolerans TaxID=415242 RepID=A0A7J0BSP2_9BACT|nr:formate dehydrogenase accessory protein FdhE [Desulfovibrio psychrotolerans]GFM36736.1 formate dehydrogenase accessory protein FdhE [Desulfovibrio psychrotolerans]